MEILENEIIDDLQLDGLKILQKKEGFKFGTDAILLSDFSKNTNGKKALDLCTGSGIIPLLLSKKSKLSHFDAIEIQQDIADMAKRSVEMNNLSDKITVTCGDLRNCVGIYKKRSFDLITCNPPYIKQGSGVLNENSSKIISRHEIKCTLEDIIKVSSELISLTGRFMMVHRPQRLTEVIFLMKNYGIEPKTLRFVHKNAKDAPVLFLIEGLYKAKSDIKILPPLVMYNDDLTATEEFKKIYNAGSEI